MKQQNVLITGGVDGLGRQLALHYAEAGCRVLVLDVDRQKGARLSAKRSNISFIPFDLSDFDEVRVDRLAGAFDTVICNAGISLSGNFVTLDFEQERHVFEVNALGHIKLIKFLLKHNKIEKRARLVFILSGFVYLPFPIALAYSASKSALNGFADALETYLHGPGMSVTRVYPGPMQTSHQIKYYQGFKENKGVRPEKVVPKVARAIARRKRRVFPDNLSKLFHIASWLAPKMLSKLSYRYCLKYKLPWLS